MRVLISIVLALLVGMGSYYFYMRRVQPAGTGMLPTQLIDTTGVEQDLLAVAQAERIYWATNAKYASMQELVSSGSLAAEPRGRRGYTYTLDAGEREFTVTARWSPPPGAPPDLHSPDFTIDQSMQIRRSD